MSIKLKIMLLSVIFTMGYTNLSYELIVLRQLVNFLGSNTLITSIIMAFIMLFLSVGYYLGSVVRFKECKIRRSIVNSIWGLAVWYMLSSSYLIIMLFFYGFNQIIKSPLGLTFFFSVLFLIIPAIVSGYVTAVISRILHHNHSDYTGKFMAVDTLGSVFGSLLTTLVLMSYLGVSQTIFVLIISTSLCVCLLMHKREIYRTLVGVFLIGMCSIGLNAMHSMAFDGVLIKDDARSRLEILSDNDNQTRLLRINGQNASQVSDNPDLMFSYIRYIEDSVIRRLPSDKVHDILILGAGGFTIGLNDGKNNYVYLDVEPRLKEISEKHFLKKPLLDNKKFVVQDAYLYMLTEQKKYDVIILDIYSSRYDIPVNFVSYDFFKMVKEHLKPNGIMAANIITASDFSNDFSKCVDNTIRRVFSQYLTRQSIYPNLSGLHNIVYTYYHYPEDETIYTIDKSSAVYGQF
ncbi:MAG: fused MFS/spermidine synthase [Alphaproteobacteria bacterium]|nr:fused MFS/spermidine synthase [Alphaproteobacteria bacterium]